LSELAIKYPALRRRLMNIQIFGVKKSFDTKKAERYFKERRIKYQFVDLDLKEMSKGELQGVKAAVGLNNLFDRECKEYERLNLHHITGEGMREEILLKNPRLYKTPIVRNGKNATVGYQPEVWDTWD
jgi:arsenate reductase